LACNGPFNVPSVKFPATRIVDDAYDDEKSVDDAFPRFVCPVNVFVPENVLLFASSVDDAAVIVMSAVPLKETPLMFRAVWSAVAVPALPEMEPVMSEEKVLEPEKVFASARSVEEAAVITIEPPALKVVPLMVPKAPAR